MLLGLLPCVWVKEVEVKAEKITAELAIQGYKEALEESRLALKVIVDKLLQAHRLDMKLSKSEYLRLTERGRQAIRMADKILEPRTMVSCFALQETTSFPDGAPQREEAHSDEHFYRACRKYAAEWVMEYKHPGKCENRDCPQCWPT